MYSFDHMNIPGYRQEPVPHTFFRQQEETKQAALIFAGRGINCQHPTLYYPTREILARGADALLIDYCLRPAFSTFSQEEIIACVRTDTLAAAQALFGGRTYERVTLIGKSLGTLAMGYLLESIPPQIEVQVIWITPILTSPALDQPIRRYHPRSLFIIGTADPYYDADELAALAKATQGETLVIPGAEHLLEVPEGIIASLGVMDQMMRAIQDFLSRKP